MVIVNCLEGSGTGCTLSVGEMSPLLKQLWVCSSYGSVGLLLTVVPLRALRVSLLNEFNLDMLFTAT